MALNDFDDDDALDLNDDDVLDLSEDDAFDLCDGLEESFMMYDLVDGCIVGGLEIMCNHLNER